MYNIGQITKDYNELTSIGSIPFDFYSPKFPLNNKDLINEEDKEMEYYEFLPGNNIKIIKLGYCVNEPKGIYYPFYLKFNNIDEWKEFYVGETGILEFQPEIFVDINNAEDEEYNITIYVTGIRVPNINFCLDYVYAVN